MLRQKYEGKRQNEEVAMEGQQITSAFFLLPFAFLLLP
jgi:hypothetical protein